MKFKLEVPNQKQEPELTMKLEQEDDGAVVVTAVTTDGYKRRLVRFCIDGTLFRFLNVPADLGFKLVGTNRVIEESY